MQTVSRSISNTNINISLKKINALTIAIFLSSQGFNIVLLNLFPSFSTLGLGGVFILCFIMMLLGIRKIRLNPIIYLCPVVVLIFYGITVILYPGKSALAVVELLTYTILPFFLVQLDFDIEDVVKWTLIIFIPVLFYTGIIFEHNYHGGISMGTSYAFMPTVICAIAYVVYYARKEKNTVALIFYLLLCFMNIYFFYQILFFGSRGPTLCILGFIVTLYFFRNDPGTGKIRTRRMMLFILIIAALVILFVFGDTIFTWIDNILHSVGLNIRFFSKSSELSQEENVLNGRSDVYTLVIREILNSPIFGHGIDMFEANTGIVYPHNFIFQILYDGGLILLAVIIIPLIIYSVRILSTHEYQRFFEWSLLFCISIPGAMFSGDLWEKYTLWIFLAFCIARGSKIKKENINADN